MMDVKTKLGDSTNPRVESESFVDGSSLGNRVDSVQLTPLSDSSTVVHGVECVDRSVAEDSVPAESNVCDVNNRTDGDSNELGVSESHDKVFTDGSVNHVKSEQQRKVSKSKESTYDSMISMFDDFAADGIMVSSGHGFEVGDMVWGKVKSHPWWPGHVYSEDFATPSVRRSKRDGLLLVAFFGDSSYGWFDPSELVPFDSDFAEKTRQTNSKAFVKAVEEAMDEVSRRSALGLSCMCRSKQNFRETGVKGFYAVDVMDYEPGAVYSIDAIEKARNNFQPNLALDFIRQLALKPTDSEHTSIDFIKNKANVVSYRRAIYEEFDDTYAQAFGIQSLHPSPGSGKELPLGRAPSKAPLSGRQVFADTSGKGKSSAKSNKPKDQAKKDKYLFKRRDDSKEIKLKKKEKLKLPFTPQLKEDAAGDYVLQKRVSKDTQEQVGSAAIESDSKDANMEDSPIVVEFGALGSEMIETKPDEENKIVPKMESSDLVKNEKVDSVNKIVGSQTVDKKVKKVSKRPVGELGPGKSVSPEKKKKRKKENIVKKEDVITPKPPVEDLDTTCSSSQDMNHDVELSRVLGDLHSLALDPFHAINKGLAVKARQVFLKFRSVVFQKSLNIAADDDATASASATKCVAEKPQQDDPTKGGRKRIPSDRQEEMAAKKKKKVGDIRNLTKEKKSVKKMEERGGGGEVKRTITSTPLVKNTKPEPTMLVLRFPPAAPMPNINELKAKFARYGPLDHTATRVLWNTFTCRVVYRYKAHAHEAHRFVMASSNLFGNSNIICTLKEIGGGDSEPSSFKVPKEDGSVEERRTVSQLKSCLKKSGGDEAAGGGGGGKGTPRVKFMLGGEENLKNKNGSNSNGNGNGGDASISSSSNSIPNPMMDINSRNFQKQSSLPISSGVSSSNAQFRPPPPMPQNSSIHYGTGILPLPPPPPPPRPLNCFGDVKQTATPPGNFVHNLQRPNIGPKADVAQQMLSLLTKCNDVVSNVTNMLGYVPYHPL